MLQAVNHTAWDSTRYVKWTFAGRHHYVWDKQTGHVEVEFAGRRVLLRTYNYTGLAWQNGRPLEGKAKQEALHDAWAYFCNDSYWLCAPNKVFDKGTVRAIVNHEEYGKSLLVTHKSGGVTPGDAYLWILDENGLPLKYKMWVSIIPIGGVEATWEGWETIATGAKIATQHRMSALTTHATGLMAGQTLAVIQEAPNLFEPLR